jgi:precorrin-2 methylase
MSGVVSSTMRQLYIVGLGVMIPGHVTVAATEALSRCQRIYSIVQEPPALWLPRGHNDLTPIVNVMSLYEEGALRSDNYARVASTILEGLRQVSAIAYVTYGNPLSYDSVAQTLVREAGRFDADVQVVPGISSIDSILCDLRVDMAPGIQIYEASWLVTSETQLNPSVAAILLQLGHFGSLRAHYRQRRRESLADLSSYLCRFYPELHTMYLVQSSNGSRAATISPVAITQLCTVDEADWAESAYLPPVQQAQLYPTVHTK